VTTIIRGLGGAGFGCPVRHQMSVGGRVTESGLGSMVVILLQLQLLLLLLLLLSLPSKFMTHPKLGSVSHFWRGDEQFTVLPSVGAGDQAHMLL
jgi:hypothetical protein